MSITPAPQSRSFPVDKPARTGLALIGRSRAVWNAADGVQRGGRLRTGRLIRVSLKETPSAAYIQRTEWNVRDSDATVLFSVNPALTGGSESTVEFARGHGKPCMHLCAGDKRAADALRIFIEKHGVKVLNVASPRSSKEPGVGEFVMRTLQEAFG